MSFVNQSVKTSLPRQEFSQKPKLHMTANLVKQIKKLHNQVGTLEWSGELITRETGTINDLDNWTVTAEDIFLVDVGTGGYTSYEVDKGSFKSADIVDLYEKFPGLLTGELKNHHIHTHHMMGSFFSGTDQENLEDRASVSNYFIMLIVDMKGLYIAKVAFKAKVVTPAINVTKSIEFFHNEDGYPGFSLAVNQPERTVETLVVMDMEVTHDQVAEEPGDWFDARFSLVKKTAQEETKKATTYTPSTFNKWPEKAYTPAVDKNKGRSTYRQPGPDEDAYDAMDYYEPGYTYNNDRKKKGVMDLTDDEWEKSQEEGKDYENIKLHAAYHLVNTVLNNNIKTDDYSSPIIEFGKHEQDSWKEMDDRTDELLMGIDINMEALYPGNTDEWALDTLKFLDDNIFERAKNNRMAVVFSRKLKAEIAKRRRTIKDEKTVSTYNSGFNTQNHGEWD